MSGILSRGGGGGGGGGGTFYISEYGDIICDLYDDSRVSSILSGLETRSLGLNT